MGINPDISLDLSLREAEELEQLLIDTVYEANTKAYDLNLLIDILTRLENLD